MTHRISEGSGIGSGQECCLLTWDHPVARLLATGYPFVGGRTPQSMKWVAVEFANGRVDCYPKNRVISNN